GRGLRRLVASDHDRLHRVQLGLLAAQLPGAGDPDLARQEVVAGADQRSLWVVRISLDPLTPVAAVPDPLAPDLHAVALGGPDEGGDGLGLPLDVQLALVGA